MKGKIEWTSVGVELPALDFQLLDRWIALVASSHDRVVGRVVYSFCNDEEILRVNRQFLSHDYYTDIITFDYSRGTMIAGDIVLSVDTVLTNAQALGVSYDRELLRVIIHGVLHLCGVNDKGPGEREIMESHENAALTLYDRLIDDED